MSKKGITSFNLRHVTNIVNDQEIRGTVENVLERFLFIEADAEVDCWQEDDHPKKVTSIFLHKNDWPSKKMSKGTRLQFMVSSDWDKVKKEYCVRGTRVLPRIAFI